MNTSLHQVVPPLLGLVALGYSLVLFARTIERPGTLESLAIAVSIQLSVLLCGVAVMSFVGHPYFNAGLGLLTFGSLALIADFGIVILHFLRARLRVRAKKRADRVYR